MTRAPDSPATWWRLRPAPSWTDPALEAVRDRLADPALIETIGAHEASATYPRPVMDALRDAGLAELFTDEARTTYPGLAALNAITARVSGSVAIAVGINSLALLPLYVAGTDPQRRRAYEILRGGGVAGLLLTEWDQGSNLLGNQTRGTPDGDDLIVDGEKNLINGGNVAELLVTLVRTGDPPEDGGPFGAAPPQSLVMIERDDTVESLPAYRTLPAPASDISGVRFHGTRVPAGAVLGRPGEGFSVVQRVLTLSRGGIASLAAGSANRAVDLATAYARDRRLYGAPLTNLGAIRDHLLELSALDLATSALAVQVTAVANARGQAAGYHTALGKLACCSLAERAVDEGRRILSARALVHDEPYAQLVRDVLLWGVFDGTRHVMLDRLSGMLAQMSGGRAGGGDLAGELRTIYGEPPASLPGFAGKRKRPWVPAVDQHAAALAGLATGLELAPVVAVARGLLGLVRALRDADLWDRDQGLRFAATEQLATLEAALATVELADPTTRDALGLAPLAPDPRVPGAATTYAVTSLAASAAAALRTLADRAGCPVDAELADAEGALSRAAGDARLSFHRDLEPKDC